jgi:Carboxypeptidase regulatory-like domain/TonB dependent receptor
MTLTMRYSLLLVLPYSLFSQTAELNGLIKDPQNAAVPDVSVELRNEETGGISRTKSNADGIYAIPALNPGKYDLTAQATGFKTATYDGIVLEARRARLDVTLELGSVEEKVTVSGESSVTVVQTDTSNIVESKAISTRSLGSTSAYWTLTAQPGVQIDDNKNIMVAGAGPSQLSVSIDGVTTVGPGTLGALTEMFPSFNAIEEIKMSQTLNPAEYGGVADIATISKSGANEFHGGLFENIQNTDFNAADTFAHQVTEDKMNNFGVYLGGPVILPKIYNGRNRTFFFGSFETLRLPKSSIQIFSVPTQAMRNGDLSGYLDPSLGGSANQLTGYPGNTIPASQLNPYSQKLLGLFYPLPNYGPAGAVANNYLANYSVPINSAQGDIRWDQNLGPKHRIFVRYSYKNRRITAVPAGPGPLFSPVSEPEIDNSFAGSYNWIISPNVLNEFRAGMSVVRRNVTLSPSAAQSESILGVSTGPGALPSIAYGDTFPALFINGFTNVASPDGYLTPREGTYQINDHVTWTKAKHTWKFGFDARYLLDVNTLAFNSYSMGGYVFDGSSLGALLGPGAATPFASFLLGYPDQTLIAGLVNPNSHSVARSYSVYAQDDYRISPSLTLNYGLRWEYHPGLEDKTGNTANFDPNYITTVNGETFRGAVVMPNQAAFRNIAPAFAEAIAPIPIITAAQDGLPVSLRHASLRDFAPRIGFAWRVFNDNRTVLRGGYGRFIETLLGGTAENAWGVTNYYGDFLNSLSNAGRPIYSLPYSWPSNLTVPGSQRFSNATALNFKDPIVEEWDLTFERDLGKGVGLRISYDGNHTYNDPILVQTNQPRPNTLGFSSQAVQAQTPFPEFSSIQTLNSNGFGNYNAGTISVKKSGVHLQFEVSYTYTRDLSNAEGINGLAFPGEGGQFQSSPYNPGLDYGNVAFARRERVLATFLYDLPFGKQRAFLNSNTLLDELFGGWRLSGIALFQSGPFLTVTTQTDPSGTGLPTFAGDGGRADTVPGASPYAGQSINQWINPNAFSSPASNIGRFGNAAEGSVVGPGTQVVSLSLIKQFSITERVRAQIGAQVSNVFNHPNYDVPGSLLLGVPGFGQLTAMQSNEGAGPRQIQLTGRLTF